MPRQQLIKIRTGSSAPTAADFQTSEPAWDGTNKKLYVKAADGSMVDIGASRTVSATSRILGRGSAGAGLVEELTLGSGLSISSGALTLSGVAASGAVTGSGLTMATARLLGRSTASTGAVEEISIGTGLSLSGGTLSATGGGGGGTKTYSVFTPHQNQPPSTAFATLDTRNSILVLDFDDTTQESAVFVGVIPEGASLGSGLIVRIWWMATTATSNSVRWGVQFEKTGTDNDADSFDTAATGTSATSGTSGIEALTSITITTIDSLAAGDRFRLKVYRDAANAGDTMTGDAELVAVEVRSAA